MQTGTLRAVLPRLRIARRLGGVLLHRVWLPERAYAAVPYFYLASGACALGGGLFLPEGSWILPYLLLMGVVVGHAGMVVASLRQRRRAVVSSPSQRSP